MTRDSHPIVVQTRQFILSAQERELVNDELISLLQGFRGTLAANQATHQSNADNASATIEAATATLESETATVAGYTDALGDLDVEIAKLTVPVAQTAKTVKAAKTE